MNYTVVINCAVWAGALAYYYIDARKWFTGPKITVDVDALTEGQQEVLREEGLVSEPVRHRKSGDLEKSGGVGVLERTHHGAGV